jgi:hypothetical protein
VNHAAMVKAEPQGNLTGASVHEQLLEVQQKSYMGGYKNKIINGNFDIWQRFQSFAYGSYWEGYTADRWYAYLPTNGASVIQMAYPLEYVQLTTGTSGTTRFEQRIESPAKFSGKIMTLSFGVIGATFNTNCYVEICYGVGGSATQNILNVTYSTSGGQKVFTFTMPDIITSKTYGTSPFLRVVIFNDNANFSKTIGLSKVQLEEGSVATSFESRHIAQETIMCQRYYEVGYHVMSSTGVGNWRTTGTFVVTKRKTPTFTPTNLWIAGASAASINAIYPYAFQAFVSSNDAGWEWEFTWTADAEL